jgi:hypothetical protein
LPVANGGTGLTSGTSGGVLYYSATGTLASSGALTANALVIGGGAGVAPSTTTTGTGILTFLGTPSSANLAAAVTDETGSGSLVFSTSPSLTTPTLGVASATSINKVAITAPATGSTLTIADGKTATFSNTLTLAGTDATTMTFPSTSSTVVTLGNSGNLTAGFTATSFNAGTKSSGTFTPAASSGNLQYATNGGAHTLAPPANDCTMVIQYTNNASAGTITTSSFTKVTGSAITTTNGNKFMMYIAVVNGNSHLNVQALQ